MSKEYFETVAQEWDTLREGFFSQAVREKAFAKAGICPGTVAVDVGSGTGFITEGLVSEGVYVIAVDESESMIRELKKKIQSSEFGCCIAEVEALPITSGSTFYVFSNMVLHHVENPPSAIKEMARILRPGGILVITDLDEHQFEFLREEHSDRWMGFKREHVKAWFEQAGLTNVDVDCVGEDCCSTSRSHEQAQISIFVASGSR
ncbi:MAG: methyltransferase domain-containing protein [Theionarchaea archaeon]|nr:methyltransferase domain-containing protein [Theionarchaea archaeon]